MTIIDEQAEQKPGAKPPRQRKAQSQAVAVQQPQAPAVAAPTITGNMLLLKQAMDQGATGEDLKNMMDLYERMEDRAARRAFDTALANAQAEIPTIVKNRLVQFEAKNGGKDTSYRHEDLANIVETIRPILHKHGLAHRFRTEQKVIDGSMVITVTCVITGHGHREETPLSSGPDQNPSGMNNLQRIASAVTYLERYTLKAALGLAAANDDDARGTTAEPVGTISALQLLELEALIREVDANPINVCRACRPPVESLAELNLVQFEKAKAKLETMRAPL